MRKRIVLSALFLAAVAAGLAYTADNKAEAIKKDLKAMEGKWTMDRMEQGGRDNPQADRMGALFDGREVTLTRDGQKSAAWKITLDPTQEPKAIDLLWSGTATGGTSLGIYRFTEDGALEICWNQAQGKGSDKRPKAFTTKVEAGAGSVLYVYKREQK